MKSTKKLLSVAVGLMLVASSIVSQPAAAASTVSQVQLPVEPVWGHFVDSYKNNNSGNLTVNSNPTIGVLSGFLDLWTPGDSWDNGTKLNDTLLDYNIQYVKDLAKTRTPEQEERAYYDDRRNQTYGATEGLGPLAEVYRSLSGTTTTIVDIPDDATSVKYNDGNNQNKAGNSDSELGKMVDLIGVVRGNYASTTPAKTFYSYMRPYRWANLEDPQAPSIIVPTLEPAKSSTPQTDGGFPSGHTNASYLAALALAYAVPERYQELLTRASEMGHSRIVAGMHSPFDVMGGRVMATGLAAAALADPDNADLKQAAYEQAHSILLKQAGTGKERFSNYEKNKAAFTERLTYGFPQINSTAEPMVVPKGAEVLLETRLPYLSAEQRREVLATTGLPSGYPVLDDPEGWGRLNLFAAADGYGAFDHDVTVAMDARKEGFHTMDQWRNDISGVGKLKKEGSGTLKLLGNNTYSGGTEVNAGVLEGGSATAFGTGDVVNAGGTVVKSVYGKMTIGGDFAQSANGTLELHVTRAGDVLEIKGAVHAGGTLHVNFAEQAVLGSGTIPLITHGVNQRSGAFDSVTINGLPNRYQVEVVYQENQIALGVGVKPGGDNPDSGGSSPSPGNPSTDGPSTGSPSPGGGMVDGGKTPTAPVEQPAPQTPAVPAPAEPPAPEGPAAVVNPFQSKAVNREAILKMISDSIAATKGVNTTYSDTNSHWGRTAIGAAVKLRIVNGHADGTFRPNASVTRAEFAAMIARAFGIATSPATAAFKDTSSHWAAGYISAFEEKGILSGYPDGSFKPNATISRAEMVTIIARVMNMNVLMTSEVISYTDVSSEHWAAYPIKQASSARLVQGVSGAIFAPNHKATRAEAVTLLIRALESDRSIKEMMEGL